MSSCGFWNESGKFEYLVGLPACTGVSGMIMLVVPDLMGVCIYSPRLNEDMISVRGLKFCEEFSKTMNLHQFNIQNKSG